MLNLEIGETEYGSMLLLLKIVSRHDLPNIGELISYQLVLALSLIVSVQVAVRGNMSAMS